MSSSTISPADWPFVIGVFLVALVTGYVVRWWKRR